MTLDEIKADLKRLGEALKALNSTRQPGEKRYIISTRIEEHSFFCRCNTCWYDYDGPGRDEEYGKPVPFGEYPTQEMKDKLKAKRNLNGVDNSQQ